MSCNPFRQVTVSPNFATGHVIQWTIDSAFRKEEPYCYSVQVSGTPDFSIIEYSIDVINTYIAIDDTNFHQTKDCDLYYRVRLMTADRSLYYSRSVVFGAVLETRRNYRLASEITRKELLRLKKYAGSYGLLMKRKNFGPIATDSVDPISGVAMTDNTSDFGTGLSGGYYEPLKVMFSYEDNKQTRVLNDAGLGVSETFDVSFRMIGYPYVETQDILIDTDSDDRFLVKSIDITFFPGTGIVLIQKVSASYVTPTDPIYKINVK